MSQQSVSNTRLRRSCLWLAALWLAAGTACSASGGDDGGADAGGADGGGPAAPSVWVGGSKDDGSGFVDWRDGLGTPPILRGPQGGQHVWVSVRMRNLHPKKLRMAFTMFVGESDTKVIPGRVEITSTLKPEPEEATAGAEAASEGPWFLYQGAPSFVKCPCQVYGKKLRVELEVIDLYGLTAKDVAWIAPTWDGNCDFEPAGSCKDQ